MKNVIYIAASLDGYIARKDGSIDWLMEIPNPEGDNYGFSHFMEGMDAIVMGRHTFEKVLTFGEWPYTKPVFVLSNKLNQIPSDLDDKAEIIKGVPSNLVKHLNKDGYHNLYIDGGKTIQNFLEADLIDEMIISLIPILLGSGIPLFGELQTVQKFQHIKTDVYKNGIVKNHYKKDTILCNSKN